MTSLRARVLTSVLALAAAGLIVMAVVTYAEQRSFLLQRVDAQARGAAPAVSFALDRAGILPPGAAAQRLHQQQEAQPGSEHGGPPAQGGRGGDVNLPPGTYGQRREPNGRVLGHVLIKYGESEAEPPAPRLEGDLPIGRPFTVGASGSSGLRYRAYAIRDPEDSGITVVAVPLREVDQTLSRLRLVEALVIAGVLAALGLSAFFVVRLGLRPLDRMEHTAGRIAAGELGQRVAPADPRTEVGRLGLALNRMLDRLESAFAQRSASEERLRQFIADASHELRTPLASIRGYAELYRIGAASDAEGTELAMRRIEEEARRMGVLVEDLLMLARLDETPEPRREAVDLAALARDAVHDARAMAPEREITVAAPQSAMIAGDAHQLRQLLGNLLRNALVHTPAGTPVEVSLERSQGTLELLVRDHGPGLPAGAAERLFERFWRAEGGRERGRAGAGLGLAIASGIVAAHHGTIAAEQAPGGGALFRVRLPALAAGTAAQDGEPGDGAPALPAGSQDRQTSA